MVVHTAVGGRLPRPEPQRLLTFMASTLFLGIAIEITLNETAFALIGRMSWQYQVWPRHGGSTSVVAAFLWPLYGAHLCLLEDGLHRRDRWPRRQLFRSLIGGVDALTMEIICNAWAIAAFGTYYFYYLAPDLMHLSAAEIFMPYVLANLLLAKLVRRIEATGKWWWMSCAALSLAALLALFFPR